MAQHSLIYYASLNKYIHKPNSQVPNTDLSWHPISQMLTCLHCQVRAGWLYKKP